MLTARSIKGLLDHLDDPQFLKKWAAVKQSNKERLAHYVETTLGFTINTQAMFDVQIKASDLLYCQIALLTASLTAFARVQGGSFWVMSGLK